MCAALLIMYFLGNAIFYSICEKEDFQVPSFTLEPPSSAMFLNSTGIVISCIAAGRPKPIVSWQRADGEPLTNIPGLRRVFSNGSIAFLPFQASDFRHDVHNTKYRCIASNTAGVIGSRIVRLKAVLRSEYAIHVDDEVVAVGNSALFRCRVPDHARDYVTVESWIRQDGLIILPRRWIGLYAQRYQVLSNGDLVIPNVAVTDSQSRYRCKVRDKLTGEKKNSDTWGKLIVTEPKFETIPKALDIPSTWIFQEAEPVLLPCLARANPVPSYSWYRKEGSRLLLINPKQESKVQIKEGLLFVPKASVEDSGTYYCLANNTLGKATIENELIIRAPLRVHIVTQPRTLQPGMDVTLTCNISGRPIKSLTWTRNVIPLEPGNRIQLISSFSLTIRQITEEDQAIYQCFVEGENDSAQGNAPIFFTEKEPHFESVFDEQIVSPRRFLSIHCSASGFPLPQVAWTIDGVDVVENRRIRIGERRTERGLVISYVNITDLQTQDSGFYECVATNSAGMVRHTARINVLGPPFVRPMENVTVAEGDSVSLLCPVVGYPIESISFAKVSDETDKPKWHTNQQGRELVIKRVRREDGGIYKCCAVNARGDRSERDVTLHVVSPPVINPFMFSKNLTEGMRSSATCSVIAGDPPVKIMWLKDGRPVQDAVVDVQVVAITDFMSSLIIGRVGRQHTGNYTCIVSNKAATVNYTSRMTVHAPPRWTIKPVDKSAVAGRTVVFDCQADGIPPPVIRWKQAVGLKKVLNPEDINIRDNSRREFRNILSSPHIHVLENGSLTITAVEKSDAGDYLCEANNGIEKPLDAPARLTVYSAARVRTSHRMLTLQKSQKASFSCIASGDNPLTISWTKDDQSIKDRYVIREEEGIDEKLSMLTISSAERSDSATFRCSVVNPYGGDAANIQVIVQEPPDPPINIRSLEVNSRSAVISWSTPYSGNSPITSYEILYKEAKDSWNQATTRRTSISGSQNSINITGLEPVTSYHFRVVAENSLGRSGPSRDVLVTTTVEAPTTPPREVQAMPIDSGSIKVSWKSPVEKLRPEMINGYYVGYKPFGSSDSYVFKTVQNTGAEVYEHKITALRRATKYAIIVQAFNTKGAGPSSDEVAVATFKHDPPNAPTLRVVATTSTSARLSWELQQSDVAPVDGFILSYKSDSGDWHKTQLPGQHRSFLLEGLTCGARYQVLLTAFNDVGRGKPSEVLQFATNGKAPVAPEKNQFVTSNVTFVTLHLRSWQDGGCVISHFVIQYKEQTQAEWILLSNHILLEQEAVVIADLRPGTWHDLLVTANNEAGSTEAEFRFATLTVTGATVPPLAVSENRPRYYLDDPTIIVPALCAVIVLMVIGGVTAFACLWRNRDHGGEGASDAYCRGSGDRGDDVSMSSYGKAKGNVAYESQREPLYYPSPYATTHIASSQVEEECVGQMQRSLRRSWNRAADHIYDVPHRPRLDNMMMEPAATHQYSRLWTNSRTGVTDLHNEGQDALLYECRERPQSLPLTKDPLCYNYSRSRMDGLYSPATHERNPLSGLCLNSQDSEEFSETECDRDHSWISKSLSVGVHQEGPSIIC